MQLIITFPKTWHISIKLNSVNHRTAKTILGMVYFKFPKSYYAAQSLFGLMFSHLFIMNLCTILK